MKRFIHTIIFIILIFPFLFADTIVFKNNCSLTNVTIIKKNNFYYYVQKYTDGKKAEQLRIPLHRVAKVIPGSLVTNATSLSVNCADFNLKQFNLRQPPAANADINVAYLATAITFAAIAYDFFADASDLQDSIDDLRAVDPSVDVSRVDSQRSRKFGVGIAVSLSSLVLFYSAFQD